MNRILITAVAFLAFVGNIQAQDDVRDMNVIKSNPNYIYATGTSLTSNDEASQNIIKSLLILQNNTGKISQKNIKFLMPINIYNRINDI